MNCKDCIHYSLCIENSDNTENCKNFAPATNHINFPCKAEDMVYYIDHYLKKVVIAACIIFLSDAVKTEAMLK